eukprot:13899016-Ditylum_brightwellii.AAC.1
MVKQTVTWLCDFQLLVDEVVSGTYFQFTAKVWKPLKASEEPTSAGECESEEMLLEEWKRLREKVKVIEKDTFPYLDMQMSQKNNNLQFLVYSKENQTIKYANKESCHRTSVFKAVPAG